MINTEIITVSIYRSDYRILIAIAKENDLRDLKNHPSIKQAVQKVLRDRLEDCAEPFLSEGES